MAALPRWAADLKPTQSFVDQRERLRSACGALLGILVAGLCGSLLTDVSSARWLMAPMGASAVILFALPASPLAQPWAVVGGNLIAATIGVTCARWIAPPVLAAPIALFFTIGAMFAARCVHPPSGAVALTAVLGGADVHALAYGFVAAPVATNTAMLLLAAWIYNNATGRRYPAAHHVETHLHRTGDDVPGARIGFSSADLKAALKDYNQEIAVSVDELETIFVKTEQRAFERRFGQTRCADIMSKDVVAVEFATELAEAWELMRVHALGALPVVSTARHVIGIVTRSDFIRHADLSDQKTMGRRLRAFLQRTPHTHSDKAEVVGQIMNKPVRTVPETATAAALVPVMADIGHHYVPIVDANRRLVGMVTQTDLVAALYSICLSKLGPEAMPAVR